MKKKLLLLLVSFVLTCTSAICGSVYAESGYITTTASSQTELTPDIINFDVEIVTTSKESMAKATDESKRICSKVYENLRKTVEKTAGSSIKTSSYSAVSIYKYTNNKKEFDYYRVTNRVRVRSKNISNAGQIMDAALSDGATSISNISYDVSSYENECSKLLAETTQKARAQAADIAKSIGTEIAGIKSIEGSCSTSAQNAVPGIAGRSRAAAYNTASEIQNTNIEAGTVILEAKVVANFYLK